MWYVISIDHDIAMPQRAPAFLSKDQFDADQVQQQMKISMTLKPDVAINPFLRKATDKFSQSIGQSSFALDKYCNLTTT